MSKNKSAKLYERIAVLERKLLECAAQMPHKPYYLSEALEKYIELEGSGVMVTFQQFGTELKVGPVLIRNGLSLETVRALQKDIHSSWEDSIRLEPKVIKADDEATIQKSS